VKLGTYQFSLVAFILGGAAAGTLTYKFLPGDALSTVLIGLGTGFVLAVERPPAKPI
jgi:hypothetical protein